MAGKKGAKWKKQKYADVQPVPLAECPAACLALIKANPGKLSIGQLGRMLGVKSEFAVEQILDEIENTLGTLLYIDPETGKYNWVRMNPPAQCLLARCPLWPRAGRTLPKLRVVGGQFV